MEFQCYLTTDSSNPICIFCIDLFALQDDVLIGPINNGAQQILHLGPQW